MCMKCYVDENRITPLINPLNKGKQVYYYHMTSIDSLRSISKYGLLPQNGANAKLIGDEKSRVFFSEGFEGAIALFVDFQMVYDKLKTGQMKVTDKDIENRLLQSEGLSDYLGEGVYLRFDGTEIKNERNFENGCTEQIILPENLNVCILREADSDSIIYSRFAIIKHMMAWVEPEQIQYYGSDYENSPNFDEATNRIQSKVRHYYAEHQREIERYKTLHYTFDTIPVKDFNDGLEDRI